MKQNHTTGLTWNPKGGSPAPASGPAPPPPPPSAPLPPPPPPAGAPDTAVAGGRGDLLAALNKGMDGNKNYTENKTILLKRIYRKRRREGSNATTGTSIVTNH